MFLANHHLTKTIEVTRVNLFNILTQYRAIFNDDEHSPLSLGSTHSINQNIIFYTWIRDKVSLILNLKDNYLIFIDFFTLVCFVVYYYFHLNVCIFTNESHSLWDIVKSSQRLAR